MYTVPAEYDQFKEELITLDTDYFQLEQEMICETSWALLAVRCV
jgi:hypothetical protein